MRIIIEIGVNDRTVDHQFIGIVTEKIVRRPVDRSVEGVARYDNPFQDHVLGNVIVTVIVGGVPTIQDNHQHIKIVGNVHIRPMRDPLALNPPINGLVDNLAEVAPVHPVLPIALAG